MADVFDYIDWRGDLSFEQDKLNEVDGMILARMAYLPFEYAFESGQNQASVQEGLTRILAMPDIEKRLLMEQDLPFMEHLIQSRRFKDLIVQDYANFFEPEQEEQFAAITLQLHHGLSAVLFRGTDSTLVGWKEDFNMSFCSPVPSQKRAIEYLERAAEQMQGFLIVAGHSKGGNLAVYASSFCTPQVQKRIMQVYSYDGPGVDQSTIKRSGYQNICPRIQTFIPQSSVVGMLLEHEEEFIVVSSTNFTLWQHDLYSWQLQRNAFIHLTSTTASSQFTDAAIKDWMNHSTPQQREFVVNTMYEIFLQTHVHTVHEFGSHWLKNAMLICRSMASLDESTRKAVMDLLLSLVKCASFQIENNLPAPSFQQQSSRQK